MAFGHRIGFIGAGNMAQALIRGLIASGRALPTDIRASDANAQVLELVERTHGVTTGTNEDVIAASDVVVLAVKPQTLADALREQRFHAKHLVVSLCAGVSLEALARLVGPSVPIVRTMPNTPSLVGAGATALSGNAHARAEHLEIATRLFDAVGATLTVAEPLLDAVTGLSGSGPAYAFLMIDALADGGVKEGLSREQAIRLAAQTLYGAAKLLIETGEHPGVLKDRVTSPGGTTIAAVHALEAGGVRHALINAVSASARRSRELGEAFTRAMTDDDA